MVNPVDFSKAEPPIVFAHRGVSDRYPENTPVAFQAALSSGVGFVELDVRLTKDGRVVIIHDEYLERTTDGHGLVGEHTLEELKQLDAGSWFGPHFSGERIPTLEETFNQTAGGACINIEIKPSARIDGQRSGDLERAVMALIKKADARHRVLISSFEPAVLDTIRELDKQIRVALIAHAFKPHEMVACCRRLHAYSFHPNIDKLELGMIEPIQKAGFYIFSFNIHTQSDMHRAMQLGLDGYFVNDPALVRQCLVNR